MQPSFTSTISALGLAFLTCAVAPAGAQTAAPAPSAQPPATAATAATTPAVNPQLPRGVETPPGYTIGADDQLSIVFWREKELSADVAVRPDGNISLPLLNDIRALGLTPDELRVNIAAAASKFVEDTTVTVVVKQINSRKVFITGMIPKPGGYALNGPTTVLQLIAMAGGVDEYAKKDEISILRTENGKPVSIRFNYDDVRRRRKLEQNIELKPGDTVIVP